MFQKIAKHRANDASNDVHRPPLAPSALTASKCDNFDPFLAVQDNSITDIVGPLEPTNNQSLGSIKEWS